MSSSISPQILMVELVFSWLGSAYLGLSLRLATCMGACVFLI
jgi:hypothetical protein